MHEGGADYAIADMLYSVDLRVYVFMHSYPILCRSIFMYRSDVNVCIRCHSAQAIHFVNKIKGKHRNSTYECAYPYAYYGLCMVAERRF